MLTKLFATVALTVLGDAVYDWQLYGVGEAPFPGWADPIYFASYVTEVAALVVLVRSRHPHRDWAQWLDSAIIASPLAAVVGLVDEAQEPRGHVAVTELAHGALHTVAIGALAVGLGSHLVAQLAIVAHLHRAPA